MAIAFTCDGCGMAYKVGDEFAGRRTVCRKCETPILVPKPVAEEFEVVEDEVVEEEFEVVEDAAPPLVRPKAKPIRAAAVEDDDDDEDEKPVKRRRRDDDDDEDDDDKPRRKISGAARDYADLLDEKERKEARKERKRKRQPKRTRGFVTPGVMGGIATVVICVVWITVQVILTDSFCCIAPVLIILGFINIIRGLISGEK